MVQKWNIDIRELQTVPIRLVLAVTRHRVVGNQWLWYCFPVFKVVDASGTPKPEPAKSDSKLHLLPAYSWTGAEIQMPASRNRL